MKLTFQSYLLVSLVTLAHVILLAVVLPSRLKLDVSGAAPGFLVDEEGMVWLGPSGLDSGDVSASFPVPETEGPDQEMSGAGFETSANQFTATLRPSAPSDGEGSVARHPPGERTLDPLSITESSEASQDDPPPIELEAQPRSGSPRPLRPLLPSSVN